MAEAVGVSRSSVSRQAIEASEKQLSVLRERRWDDVEILVIYIDGQRFGRLVEVNVPIDRLPVAYHHHADQTENDQY